MDTTPQRLRKRRDGQASSSIPVVADFDNRYPGVEVLLQSVDFPITSHDFPERITGEKDLLKSLPKIFSNFKCRLIGRDARPARRPGVGRTRFIFARDSA